MAIMTTKSRIPYFKFIVAGQDTTDIIGKSIQSIDINYSAKKVASATVNITSKSVFQEIFVAGASCEIHFGYHPLVLNKMITGKINVEPEGETSEYMAYSIPITGTGVSMASAQKNRTFPVPIKNFIVNQIASENGYLPVVVIADILPLPATELPVQNGETDLAYLYRQAEKWGCLMWFGNMNQLYFIDRDKAFLYGNQTKTVNIGDKFPQYQLGYRSDTFPNNVKKVAWRKESNKGGAGGPVGSHGSENSIVNVPEDFSITYMGAQYRLKPAIIQEIKNSPAAALKYSTIITRANIEGFEDVTLKQYFVPLSGQSRTNKNRTAGGGGSGSSTGWILDIELNEGDIYIRPPREGLFACGGMNPKADTADLPGYIMRSNPLPIKIIEYKCALNQGGFTGSMVATI